ncbi:unnamed protein product [Camellia sinensis]
MDFKPIFQRCPRPEEYQSLSLIYNDSSLDLICKDKDEAKQWFIGLKALIWHGHQQKWRTESRSDGIPSEANSPRTYTQRSSPLNSPFGSGDSFYGVCVQSREHPGCVWDVKFLENGDIVTACSDGVVRIWTIHQDKEEGWRIEIGRITKARGFIGSRNKRWPDKGCKRRGQWCSIFMEYEGAVNKVQELHKLSTEEGPTSIKDDAIVHSFGPERCGRVRGLGFVLEDAIGSTVAWLTHFISFDFE